MHGPDSFPGLCQQIFRNLLAEERTLFATPSTPVEFLEADYLQGLSIASLTHLVLLFISSSLLSSDSFLSRPLGFLKVLLPQTWCPTQVTQFAVIHEESLGPQPQRKGPRFTQSFKSETERFPLTLLLLSRSTSNQ